MITVEGYSGCEVRIIKKGPSEYVVEKGSNDPKYVPRLLKQRDKQIAAHFANTFSNVVIPRILYTKQLIHEEHSAVRSEAEEDTNKAKAPMPSAQACVVGMPFYHHTDSISFLSKASMDDVKLFSDCLLDTIDQNLRLCSEEERGGCGGGDDEQATNKRGSTASIVKTSPCDITVFTEKLLDIVKVCANNKQIQTMEDNAKFFIGGDGSCGPLARIRDVIVPSLIRYLEAKGVVAAGEGEQKDAKVIHIPLGFCHGDFTLSNVLILTPHPNETFLNFTVPIVDKRTDTSTTVLAPCSPFGPSGKQAHHSSSRSPSSNSNNNAGGSFRIALIDFLDSFVESPLADMAKLCQDLKYGWTLRLLSTPKKPSSSASSAAGPAADGGELKSAGEKAIFARLKDAEDRTKAPPVSAAAAARRRLLLQATAKEIFRDSAASSSNASGSDGAFAEGLQSTAVQVFAAMHHIYEDMLRRYSHFAWFEDYFLVFFIMNQLRVLQYSKDTDAALYLYRSVEEEFKLFEAEHGASL